VLGNPPMYSSKSAYQESSSTTKIKDVFIMKIWYQM
jgi:hypothetical protein